MVEIIKEDQTAILEVMNTINEMKNTIESINKRLDKPKESVK